MNINSSATIKTREFLYVLADMVRQMLPQDLRNINISGPMPNLVKLYYTNKSIHYEVWIRKQKHEIELGLHFEGTEAINNYYIETIPKFSSTIHESLGPGIQIAKWVNGWTRIHESIPMQNLNEDFLFEVSAKLTNLIKTMEPIISQISPE